MSIFRTHITFLFLLFFGVNSIVMAQKKPASIWATARFNKKEVMVGEPLVVTITVYTSTWFTEPPVFEEIQVSGALMVRLENTVGAKTVTIARKKYPAIEQKYVVYPSIIGENLLPSFEVVTNCPPEGDYKGVERIVRTKASNFTVQPPPDGVDTSNWLSSYNVNISETWDRPLENLKAGDVLERRIRIRAAGTLAALIPPVEIPAAEFGTVYPKTPILGNIQNQGSFTGSRTEIITYLLEKDGDFTIPAVNVPWFSISSREEKLVSLEAISLSIAANPDLEFILSRQKALQEELAKEAPEEVEEKEAFEFLGLNWWQLLLIILTLFAMLLQARRWLKQLQIRKQERQEKELASEGHYFELLKEVSREGDSKTVVRQLFFWYDRFREGKYDPRIRDFAEKSESGKLLGQLENSAVELYAKDQLDNKYPSGEELMTNLEAARKSSKAKKEVEEEDAWLNINPE